MTRYPAYPKYKETGIEWLGEIPAHWEVHRLKHISSINFSNVDKHTHEDEESVYLCNYTDVYHNDYIVPEMEFMKATASPNEIEEFTLSKGDIIVTKDSETWDDIAVPAYVAYEFENVLCGYHLALITPDPNVTEGSYLFRQFFAPGINAQFKVTANGITRYGLGKYWLDNALFLVPPLPEQRAIAAFLDERTARLDAAAAEDRRQADLLREQRAALISHAVTQGLDPDAPRKDSGIPWLGEIPAHWEVMRIKYLLHDIVDTEHKTAPFYPDGEYLVVRTSNIRNGQLIFDDAKYTDFEGFVEWTQRGVPEPGDILFTREAPAGEACIVPAEVPLCIGQRTVLLRVNQNVLDSQFALWSLYSGVVEEFIELLSQGSTVDHLNMADIPNIPIVYPPLPEQRAIAAYLDEQTARIDAALAEIDAAIAHLEEYRAALIAAAVTGKIDVR